MQLSLRARLLWWTVVHAERLAQWCRFQLLPRRPGRPTYERACVEGMHARCDGGTCACICHEAPR